MARPELDREAHHLIVSALRSGHFLDTAAALAGFRASTVNGWIRLGAEPGNRYEQFAIDCRRAIAESEDEPLQALKAEAAGNPKVLQWFLERRFPEHWSIKVQHVVREELSGALERVEALVDRIGEENLALVLGALAGSHGSGEAQGEADAGLH